MGSLHNLKVQVNKHVKVLNRLLDSLEERKVKLENQLDGVHNVRTEYAKKYPLSHPGLILCNDGVMLNHLREVENTFDDEATVREEAGSIYECIDEYLSDDGQPTAGIDQTTFERIKSVSERFMKTISDIDDLFTVFKKDVQISLGIRSAENLFNLSMEVEEALENPETDYNNEEDHAEGVEFIIIEA